jgi:hypothetical protein
MEVVQFAEVCKRMELLWPSRRMSAEMVQEWHRSFGTWADYAGAMRALGRLAEESTGAPSMAALIQTYRQIAGKPRRTRDEHEHAENMRDFPRLAAIATRWIRIQRAMRRSPEIRAMFVALMADKMAGGLQEGVPTNAEGEMIAEALMDEIQTRGVNTEPKRAPAKPHGEFAPVGAVLEGTG